LKVKIDEIQKEFDSNNLDGLQTAFLKLMTKANQQDPVTGISRYGPIAKSKITSLGETVSSLKSRFSEASAAANTKLGEIRLQQSVPSTSDLNAEQVEIEAIRKQQQIDEEKERQLQEDIQLKAKRIKEEEQQLAEQANRLREKKAAELLQLNLQMKATEERLQSMLNVLNNQYKNYHDRLADFVETFVQTNTSIVGVKDCRQAISTAMDILERIIRRPDDVACRKLRVNHPTLQSRLTGLRGGIELLVCCGFKAIAVHNVEGEAPITSGAAKAPIHDNHNSIETDESIVISTTTVVEQGVFALLAPETEWTVLLEMTEPPLDLLLQPAGAGSSGDKMTWISWFDGLQRHRDILQAVSQRLR